MSRDDREALERMAGGDPCGELALVRVARSILALDDAIARLREGGPENAGGGEAAVPAVAAGCDEPGPSSEPAPASPGSVDR